MGLHGLEDPCDQCGKYESTYDSPYCTSCLEQNGGREHNMNQIVGKTTVTVQCLTPRAEPTLCDGWRETIELDAPARQDGDRIILPGFDGRCPECGDSTFKIEGKELMFHV